MSSFRGGKNAGHFYSNITQPIAVSLSFVVDSTNANGLGISSLKSNGWVKSVFMHTTQTPGAYNGATNPNPAAGYAIVQLKQNFNIALGEFFGSVAPLTGGNLTSTTNHGIYVITALGTATAAQWLAAGVPAGVTPAVGVSFVAIQTATIGGSATVKIPGASGCYSMEVVGNPNLSISNSNIAVNGGAYILVQFMAPTSASVTTPVATAPTDTSVVQMTFLMDQSSADPLMQNGDVAGS